MKNKLFARLSWIVFLASAVGEWGFNVDLPLTPLIWLAVAVTAVIVPSAHAAEITNSWINITGGKWETNANWSVSDPSLNNAAVMITNAFGPSIFSKTIRIDALTVSTSPGSLIFSNLTISGPLVPGIPHPTQGFNGLLVQDTGATSVHIVHQLLLTTGSVMAVSNSIVAVGAAVIDDGYLELDKGATLISTNSPTIYGSFVGLDRTAQMAMTGGTWLASILSVGQDAGSAGLLEFSSGTITVSDEIMYIGYSTGASGTISMSGGTMNLLNLATVYMSPFGGTGNIFMSGGNWNGPTSTMELNGTSQVNISGGTFTMEYLDIGDGVASGNAGTFTLSGGTCSLESFQLSGDIANPACIWLTGGQLLATNNPFSFGSTASYIGESAFGSADGQVTVSNGVWLATEVDVGASAGSQGTLSIAGGTTTLLGQLYLGASVQSTGTVWLTGGLLTTTNNAVQIGLPGVGQMTVSNGTWNPLFVSVGVTNASHGSLTLAGGTISFGANAPTLLVGQYTGSSGELWVTGGQLLLANGVAEIGVSGAGILGQSNGLMRTDEEVVGFNSGSTGQLVVAGGTHVAGTLLVAGVSGSIGSASVAGGQLITTNTDLGGSFVGFNGTGQMNVSAGSWQAGAVSVATLSGSQGTLTFAGGVTTMTNLVLGNCTLGTPGYMIVNSGDVFVTNAAHTATIDVRDGFVLMNGGQLIVDRLVITNNCGLFFHDAGTLSVGTLVLDPNLDADDDGLPNGWEQAHGLDPLSSTGVNGASGDPDHDGFSNLEEYQAGTDPQNFNSNPLHVTSITQLGNNVLVTWLTTGGKTNVLQFTKGAAGGVYSNNFTALSPVIVPGGVGLTTTNYLDIGGATNSPTRYYRVRLVP